MHPASMREQGTEPMRVYKFVLCHTNSQPVSQISSHLKLSQVHIWCVSFNCLNLVHFMRVPQGSVAHVHVYMIWICNMYQKGFVSKVLRHVRCFFWYTYVCILCHTVNNGREHCYLKSNWSCVLYHVNMSEGIDKNEYPRNIFNPKDIFKCYKNLNEWTN